MPKRAVVSLQEDNGRARSQIYRDSFSAWRSQSYNPPIQRRDVASSAAHRAGAGAWSSAVFQESGIVLEEPVNPLAMLKKRQERAGLRSFFLTENIRGMTTALSVTVDPQGQKAESFIITPLQRASILQQQLQAVAPRVQGPPGVGGGQALAMLTAGGVPTSQQQQQVALPSPQFIAMNPGSVVRRQVQFPSANLVRVSPLSFPSLVIPSLEFLWVGLQLIDW